MNEAKALTLAAERHTPTPWKIDQHSLDFVKAEVDGKDMNLAVTQIEKANAAIAKAKGHGLNGEGA